MDFGLDPIDTDPPAERVLVTDHHVQAALPAVDVLFVVDDTKSMDQEQASLAEGFASFADALASAGVAWHLGVTSTDASGDRAGWLRGEPWVLTPDLPDAVERCGDALQVGTGGAAPEAGLGVAVRALELAGRGGPNAGFRRPDAVLHVVFVSDADDASEGLLGPDPVSAFLDRLDEERARTGLPARASAVVGDLPSGCTSARGAARPGFRYHEAVESTGGAAASICALSFAGVLAAIGEAAVDFPTSFALRALPEPGTLRVSVNGVRQVAGWVLQDEPPAVVFDVAPPAGADVEATYVVALDDP